MTDVHCDNRICLNNHKVWCSAKGIHVDDLRQCKSYARLTELARHACAKVRRADGKYRSHDTKVYR